MVIRDARIFQRGAEICGLEIPMQVNSRVEDADWSKGIPVLDQRDLDPEEVPYAQINVKS